MSSRARRLERKVDKVLGAEQERTHDALAFVNTRFGKSPAVHRFMFMLRSIGSGEETWRSFGTAAGKKIAGDVPARGNTRLFKKLSVSDCQKLAQYAYFPYVNGEKTREQMETEVGKYFDENRKFYAKQGILIPPGTDMAKIFINMMDEFNELAEERRKSG